MAFKYDPKAAIDCLPAGTYDGELESVEETTSKAGKPMLVVEWHIPHHDGRTFIVKDYIVNPSTLFKLKGIAKALSLMGEFDAGTLDLADHIGQICGLELTVESSEKYGDKNNVKHYREPTLEPSPSGGGGGPTMGEEIPFSPSF